MGERHSAGSPALGRLGVDALGADWRPMPRVSPYGASRRCARAGSELALAEGAGPSAVVAAAMLPTVRPTLPHSTGCPYDGYWGAWIGKRFSTLALMG